MGHPPEAHIEMKRILIATLSLCSVLSAAPTQRGTNSDFAKMEQIVRVATKDLSGNGERVVIAAEDNRESLHLRHWIVTIQPYPTDYKAKDEQKMGVLFSGPPCSSEKAGEFCSIKEIFGEPLFQGRFDIYGDALRFVGNVVSTAAKMSDFNKQLNAHQEWTQADIAAALASAGAKFGPDKEKEFTATLPIVLKTLEKAFGPMRVHKVSTLKPGFLTRPSKTPALIGWPAYWSVSTILLQNRRERLVMYFEPFEGQLQSLYVSQGSTILDPKTHKPKWKPPDD
jgi:hypothetical protein